jgi:hypothetical protein
MSTNLATIGTIVESLPAPIELNTSLIAAELSQFSDSAAKATNIAERAEIEDQDSYDRGADVIVGINRTMKAVETARKEKTAPFDASKAILMTLYGTPSDLLKRAKDKLTAKMQGWHRSEEARRRKEAAEQERAQREQAEALARAQASMGDEEGAEQIMAEAQELVVAPEKIVAKGNYGASGGARKRPVGQITNKRAFLAWALTSAPAVVDAIEVNKTTLNSLAKDLLDAGAPATDAPGFKFEYDEGLTFR